MVVINPEVTYQNYQVLQGEKFHLGINFIFINLSILREYMT